MADHYDAQTCDKRHRILWWWNATLVTAITLCISITGYCVTVSMCAERTAGKCERSIDKVQSDSERDIEAVRSAMRVQEKEQEGKYNLILQRIDALTAEINAQRRQIEQIWRGSATSASGVNDVASGS
jgi:hypothetical protein